MAENSRTRFSKTNLIKISKTFPSIWQFLGIVFPTQLVSCLVACVRSDMEIQYSQLKINHLNNTPSTKAAGGGIFGGVFQQGRQGTSQGQEDFELSWYLSFQQFLKNIKSCYSLTITIVSQKYQELSVQVGISK